MIDESDSILTWSIPRFEIGYWLRTSQCGNGYMTAEAEKLTSTIFFTCPEPGKSKGTVE